MTSTTYRSISTLSENPLSRRSSQRLRTGDHTLGTMDGTSPAGERDKVRVRL